jgi:hypothetical protein
MDFSAHGYDAAQNYDKWYLLTSVVQTVRNEDSWVEIRNPDDHVESDHVIAKMRPDQLKTLANYPPRSDILLICHGAWGLD